MSVNEREPTGDESYCYVGRHDACSGYTEDMNDAAEVCDCDCHEVAWRIRAGDDE